MITIRVQQGRTTARVESRGHAEEGSRDENLKVCAAIGTLMTSLALSSECPLVVSDGLMELELPILYYSRELRMFCCGVLAVMDLHPQAVAYEGPQAVAYEEGVL